MRKRRILQLSGLMAALIALLLMTGCGEQKKNAADYIRPVFQGLDGNGTLSLVFDRDQLTAEISEKKQMTDREKENLEHLLSAIEKDYIISSKTGLSNGDTVEITGGLDKELLKDYGIIFENNKTTVTVEGLVEPVSIKVEDYITGYGYGFEGNGGYRLDVDYNLMAEAAKEQVRKIDPDFNNDSYTVNNQIWECIYSLSVLPNTFEVTSNGETVQAEVSMEVSEIPEYGIVFETADLEKTVSGLAPTETVVMTDYLEMSSEGFESFGSAWVNFNRDKLVQDLVVRLKEDQRGAYGSAYEGEEYNYQNEAEDAADSIVRNWERNFRTQLSSAESLSNGDEVTVTCVANGFEQDSSEEVTDYGTITDESRGIIMKGGSFTRTVEGLAANTTLDLSKYLSFEFSGFNGQGTYTILKDAETLQADLDALIVQQVPELEGEEFSYNGTQNLLNGIAWEGEIPVNLCEGDTVSQSFTLETTGIPSYGIVLTASDLEAEVSGLVPEVTIDMGTLIQPVFTGFNGAGHLTVEIPEGTLQEAVRAAFEENGRGAYALASEDMDYALEAENAAGMVEDVYYDSFERSISKEDHISNGDVITISARLTEDAGEAWDQTVIGDSIRIDDLGLVITGYETEITAGEQSELPAPEEIDLTQALTVTFSGICPYVTASVETDESVPYLYQTNLSELAGNYDISAENGDSYEIVVSHEDEELLEMGYLVVSDTKQYEISGLDTWTLDPQNAQDPSFDSFAGEAAAQARDSFLNNAQSIQETIADGEGWIVWDAANVVADEMQYAQGTPESSRKNMLAYKGHITVPVRLYDRSISYKELSWISQVKDISRNLQGELFTENALETNYYYSEEEAAAELDRLFTDAVGETVSPVILAMPETQETMTLSETVQEIPEQAEALPRPQAQEVSAEIREQAVAGPVIADGHTYYLFEQIDGTNLTWKEAKEFCENAGGHLVTISSWKEEDVLRYLMKSASYSQFWQGGTDEAFEGDWKWVTGEEFSFINWDSSQPDNYTGNDEGCEDYMTIYSNGTWNDNNESNRDLGFILEMEPVGADTAVQTIPLAQMTPCFVQNTETRESSVDPYGNLYFETLALNAGERAVLQYDLKGTCEVLSFTLSTTEDAASEASYELAVWGDEQLLYGIYDYTKVDAPVQVNLNVSGVNRLSIQVLSLSGGGWMLLNDAVLVPADGDVQSTEPKLFLKDFDILSNNSADILTGRGLRRDASGRICRDAVVLESGNNSELVFLTDPELTEFSAVLAIATRPAAANAAVKVQFLGDGEVMEEYIMAPDSPVVPVQLNTEGISNISVRIQKENEEARSQQVILGNLCLKKAETADEADEAADEAVEAADEAVEAAEGEDAGAADEDGQMTEPEEQTGAAPETDEQELQFAEPKEGYDTYAAVLTCGNYRYFRYDEAVTYKRALTFVKTAGGTLADPKTAEQQRAVELLSNSGLSGYSYWIKGTAPDDIHKTGGIIMQIEAEETPAGQETVNLTSIEAQELVSAGIQEYPNWNGNYYPGNLNLYTSGTAYAVWNLNGAYEKLSAEIALAADANVNDTTVFVVFGDGEVLFKQKQRRCDDPFRMDLDVSGVLVLQIAAFSPSAGTVWVLNPQLTAADHTSTVQARFRLEDLTIVDEAGTDHRRSVFTDDQGVVHDRYISMNSGAQGYVFYNLNGSYVSLQMKVVSGSDTASAVTRTFRILADGETVYETELSGRFGQTELIELDLTGVNTLRMETASQDGQTDWIYLADDLLK